ncbi:MAG: diguanylate cyclase [Planctomycetota bacterium]
MAAGLVGSYRHLTMALPISAAWCVSGSRSKDPPPPPLSWLDPIAVDAALSAPPGEFDVLIVDQAEVAEGELSSLLAQAAPSLLVLCDPDRVEGVLDRLRPSDELCLRDAPATLIAHRLDAQALANPRLGIRGQLVQQLTELGAKATAEDPVSLALFDLDRFKMLNDLHGHAVGDRVLTEIGRRLNARTGARHRVFRFGGDEFAITAPLDAQAAQVLVGDMLQQVRGRPVCGVQVTASAGIVTATSPADVAELLRRADEALYSAKAGGRDCAISFASLRGQVGANFGGFALEAFVNRTRVMTERVAEAIAQQGQRLFQELRREADVDALTGLYARRYFDRRLPTELQAAARENLPVTVAQIDVDDFGKINKQHGWPAGDAVLQQLAIRIQDNLRGSDWVARRGGDELFVVMVGTDGRTARTVLNRLRSAVANRPFHTAAGTAIPVTITLGVAEAGADALPELLERVSKHLLTAKRSGKNQIVVCDALEHSG